VYTFYVPTGLITNLDDQLARRLSARWVDLGQHTLSGEGIFVEDVDLHHALAHSIEEELGVVGILLRSDCSPSLPDAGA